MSSHDHFLGRSAELAWLEAQLTEVRRGTPRVVVLEGSAGLARRRLTSLGRFDEAADALDVVEAVEAIRSSPACRARGRPPRSSGLSSRTRTDVSCAYRASVGRPGPA
jgi:hypothetical protein